MVSAVDRMLAKNRAARAGETTGLVIRLLWSAALFSIGGAFVGISVYNGFEPQRALAGCALIYMGKTL